MDLKDLGRNLVDWRSHATVIGGGPFSLWVGAGVPMYIGQAGGHRVPSWTDLVTELEAKAEITSVPRGLSLAERVDNFRYQKHRHEFQMALRSSVMTNLCKSLVALGQRAVEKADPIPVEVRTLAKLGMRASAITNFNLETLSTRLIACGGTTTNILPFSPPVIGSVYKESPRFVQGGTHMYRSALHPHGAIDMTGICVLGAKEYASMQGTMALQVASHSAYGIHLMIVGMSLGDRYLRQQLEAFREQINQVTWFTGKSTFKDKDGKDADTAEEVAAWVVKNHVTTAVVDDWGAFWELATSRAPEPDEYWLAEGWMSVYRYAYAEANGYRIGANTNHFKRGETSNHLIALAAVHVGNQGIEPGLPGDQMSEKWPYDDTYVRLEEHVNKLRVGRGLAGC